MDKTNFISTIKKNYVLKLLFFPDTLKMLARRFPSKCTRNDRFQDLFPLNDNHIGARNEEKFPVIFASTDRLKNSAIPAMQRLLNRPKKKTQSGSNL